MRSANCLGGVRASTKRPIQGMYWSAIVNGLLAPFLLVGILIVACDRKIMRGMPSSMLSRVLVALTTVAMFGAAIAMFVVT